MTINYRPLAEQAYLDQLFDFIRAWEGEERNPYLDTHREMNVREVISVLVFLLAFTAQACQATDGRSTQEGIDGKKISNSSGANTSPTAAKDGAVSDAAVCNYVKTSFEKGELSKNFLKQTFIHNGLFKVSPESFGGTSELEAVVVEAVGGGGLFNAYLEKKDGKRSLHTLEFMRTIDVLNFEGSVLVLTNLSQKRMLSDAAVYKVDAGKFVKICDLNVPGRQQ